MYIPKAFSITDFELVKNFIHENPLGILIATKNMQTEICPVPLLWHDDGSQFGSLIGHIAKMNSIVSFMNDSCQVSFCDNGHYISPNWYPSKAKTHKEVPTWNYRNIQLNVTPTLYHTQDKIQEIVAIMTDTFERNFTEQHHQSWSLTDAPLDYIDSMCKVIVGFKLTINSFEAKFKLSQNKSDENKLGVIEALKQVNSHHALVMAKLIH